MDRDGIVEPTDTYVPHAGGLGFLPDFDLEIHRTDGPAPELFAVSRGLGGTLSGENVEHLHVPVPATGSSRW